MEIVNIMVKDVYNMKMKDFIKLIHKNYYDKYN